MICQLLRGLSQSEPVAHKDKVLKMRKILLFGLVLLLTSGCFASVVSINAPLGPVSVGDSFLVTVEGSNFTDLYAFQFDLAFDPTLTELTSITEGGLLLSGGSTFFSPGVIDKVVGLVEFTANSLLSPVPGVNGSGIFASFQFKALSSGTSPLLLSNVFLLDSALSDLSASIEGSSVTIDGSSAPPEIPEPASVTLCLSGILAITWIKRRQWKAK